jgi:hypothetical protein
MVFVTVALRLILSMDHGIWWASSLFTIGNQFPTAACPLNGWATNQLLDSDHTDAIAYILFQENHAPFVCGSTMPD